MSFNPNPSPNIAGEKLAGTTDSDNDSIISNLRASHAAISAILRSSSAASRHLDAADRRLSFQQNFIAGITPVISALQSQAIATKSLNLRINQAVSPAISFLRVFSRAKWLENRLVGISAGDGDDGGGDRDLMYVDCVGRLSAAVAEVTAEGEAAVKRLQEAVEFLGRTKTTNKLRLRRLRDAAAALRVVCVEEVEQMRYGKSISF